MPCRLGITTDPGEKRKYWQNQVEGLSYWQILTSFEAISQAQTFEIQFAKAHGCQASLDSDDASGTLYIYHFEYTRERS